jgi:hypothetical protein
VVRFLPVLLLSTAASAGELVGPPAPMQAVALETVERQPSLRGSMLLAGLSGALDLATTEAAIAHTNGSEANPNPIMRTSGGRAAFVAAQLGLVAYMDHKNPKWGRRTAWAITAVHVAASAWNVRQMAR